MQDKPNISAEDSPKTTFVLSKNGRPLLIEPDLDFIRMLGKHTPGIYKKCMQCGTCSATCELSPDPEPFPRKEMAWASWGMKDLLLGDPDVWLCHQCNDCSAKCPRDVKPGDVMAGIRQAGVIRWSFPSFLGKWASEPQSVIFLLAIPTLLLILALYLKDPIANVLGIIEPTGERIIYPYSSMFPHWLLISFFMFFSILASASGIIGAIRFWKAMKTTFPRKNPASAKSLFSSIIVTLKKIIFHDDFSKCTESAPRLWSHMLVLFGFAGLSLVTFWIITIRINPFIQGDFIYPFSFWSPWKILANLGGAAVLAGILLMIMDRYKGKESAHTGKYFDWLLLGTILIVVITGYITEVLHYVRLDPHRHLAYFTHLVFVLGLILYLPYSKLAHIFYRTTALIYDEYTGRNVEISTVVNANLTVNSDGEDSPRQEEETASEQGNATTQNGS
ncbi:hypothetical protein CEE37_12140 [candidate division LCP-89 bacterium B3_LCP]|uniref:4Fe-4S ferredoxin-type domain-containing protein n=1 Tax=candidate division LCP-89 bacterium B3_LCP TaxID=2012998 RepID=A0A532UUB3_UNCL8|nr:MAG: hypothetical protein CEE37_12140 [candidate division LCP-89 bacterium B3_LCP]